MGVEPVACLLRRSHEVLAEDRPPATDAHGERPNTINNKHHRAYERPRPQHETAVEDDFRSTATVVFGDNFPTPERPEELRGIDGDGRGPFGFMNLCRPGIR
jgi:hypothetical protein